MVLSASLCDQGRRQFVLSGPISDDAVLVLSPAPKRVVGLDGAVLLDACLWICPIIVTAYLSWDECPWAPSAVAYCSERVLTPTPNRVVQLAGTRVGIANRD